MLSNKFAGKCKKCGVNVGVRQGKVIKNHGTWELYCNADAEEADIRIHEAEDSLVGQTSNFEYFHKKKTENWWDK